MLKHFGYLILAFVVAVIGSTAVSRAQEAQRPVIDYSGAYGMGGVPRFIEPPRGRERTIIDLNPSINVSGILGCSGLEIDAMMRDVLGVGNVDASQLADQMMQNLQSQFAQEMLTQVMADPTIASIQQQVSALAHARLTMIKQECNAIQAQRDGAPSVLLAEAQQRCQMQHGPNDERCENGDYLRSSVEEVLEEDRWKKSFRQQICDRETEQCDWVQLLPDYKPDLDGVPNDNNDTSDDGGSEAPSGGEESSVEAPDSSDSAATPKEVKPPIFSLFDVKDTAFETAFDLISQNAQSARDAVNTYGYTDALRLANDEKIDEGDEESPNDSPEPSGDSSEEDHSALPVTIKQIMSAQGCAEFSVIGAGGFESNPLEESAGERSLGISPPTPTNLPSSIPVTTPREPANGLFPMLWPAQGRVSSPGPQMRVHPKTKKTKMHNGTDIAIPIGTAILAPATGTYIRRGFQKGGAGLYSWLIAGGYKFKFFHLNGHVAPNGAKVQRGQLIAKSGNTGSSTGPHLHFEVWNAAQKPLGPGSLDFEGYNSPVGDNSIYSPDSHGNAHFVASVAENFDPNDPYIKAMTEDIQKLGVRIAQASACLVNTNLDPHVYIKMGLLPDVMYESMIDSLSTATGHQATLAILNATILQLSLSLARKSGDGENAMNPATQKFAIQQIELLKNMRDALQIDFDMKKEVAARVNEMNDYIEQAQRRIRGPR